MRVAAGQEMAGGGKNLAAMSVTRSFARIALTGLLLFGIASARPQTREEGPLVFDGIPPIPQALKERLRQYSEARSATMAGWDEGGQGLYILTRFANTAQLHRVKSPGAARYQLTFDDEPIAGVDVRRNIYSHSRQVTRRIDAVEGAKINVPRSRPARQGQASCL